MQIHELLQGSDEWHHFRLEHFGASEAAAMLGLSKKVKRNELLHMKKTGTAKEFSEWVQKNILDHGHEVEALARPFIERDIGEDLYPVTCSEGILSASCDGLTISESHGWEHKQWNATLAAAVAAKELPDEFMVQPQQCLMVTGAERWTFTVSDGTEENRVSMEILPDPVWFDRIRAGWKQFEKDLAEYVPVIEAPAAVGRAPESLPALHIEVTGMVTASNLDKFKAHAITVFKGINRELTTDQDFANAAQTVKWCEDIEDRLAGAKQHALSQTESIDALFRTIDEIAAEARATRLELDKLVEARKKQIRLDIQQDGVKKLVAHIEALNTRLGKAYMPGIPADFAGVMKGKKTVASLRDAVDTELARAKIAANEIADRIQVNLTTLRELAADHAFLFADTAQIVLKSPDDCTSLVKLRIAEHKAAEEKRLENDRAKIAEQERVKAEAKARAEIAEAKRKQEAEAAAANQAATSTMSALSDARAAESLPGKMLDELEAVTTELIADMAISRTSIASRAALLSPPTLRLGQISEHLGFVVTADFLTSLGFPPAEKDGSAKLYHFEDFPRICAALVAHIQQVQERLAA